MTSGALIPYVEPEDGDDHPSLGRAFRVVAKLRNNRLIRAREELGWSPREAAEKIGVSYATLLSYEGLKLSPWAKLRWRESAQKIADFYGHSPEELWPDVVRAVKERAASIEIATPTLAVAPCAPDVLAEDADLAAKARKLLDVLTPRERLVLSAHFGIGGEEENTLDEIASKLNVTYERIRQIEAKALHKLRDPKVAAIVSESAPNICPACTTVLLGKVQHDAKQTGPGGFWTCSKTRARESREAKSSAGSAYLCGPPSTAPRPPPLEPERNAKERIYEVCTSLPVEEALAKIRVKYPHGPRWEIASAEPEPCNCPGESPESRHYRFR